MSKVKFIDRSHKVKCYRCNGKGTLSRNIKACNNHAGPCGIEFYPCTACEGTGVFKKSAYICVAEKPDGQRIAFDCDQGGK